MANDRCPQLPSPIEAQWIAIGAAPTNPLQTMIYRNVAGLDIVVAQDDVGIRAFERACPHEQADLSRGHIADGRIHCPHHRASFSLVTGAVSAGWSCRPLRLFPVHCHDGLMWIDRAADGKTA